MEPMNSCGAMRAATRPSCKKRTKSAGRGGCEPAAGSSTTGSDVTATYLSGLVSEIGISGKPVACDPSWYTSYFPIWTAQKRRCDSLRRLQRTSQNRRAGCAGMNITSVCRRSSPRSIVPEIPRWLDEVVCRLLSKEPEDRYPDAYVLGLRLQEIPRKVALSESEPSQESDRDDDTSVYRLVESGGDLMTESGAAATMPATAVTADAGMVAGAGPAGGLGNATLARDLMKFEIERQAHRGTWRGFWNSTSGLLLALLLVVMVAVVMWWQGRMSPAERVAAVS